MTNKKFVVYSHYLDGICLWVGYGVEKRPYDFIRRSDLWKTSIKNSTGQLIVSILHRCRTRNQARQLERIETFHRNPFCNRMIGVPKSIEQKRKMGASKKGISTWSKGKHFTKIHRIRIRRSLLGKEVPQETRDKISKKLKGRPRYDLRGIKPWCAGIKIGPKHAIAGWITRRRNQCLAVAIHTDTDK